MFPFANSIISYTIKNDMLLTLIVFKYSLQIQVKQPHLMLVVRKKKNKKLKRALVVI